MTQKDEAAHLLRKGLYPLLIAKKMDISVESVIQHLRTNVGEGSLRLSDVYFSWPSEKREIVQEAIEGQDPDDQFLQSNGLCHDEIDLFKSLRSDNIFAGDMYEYVDSAEVALHRLVRATLERKFGSEESGWWREGIGIHIREKCAGRREHDDEPSGIPPFEYTTLIDLSEVIWKNWPLFKTVMPDHYRDDRKQLKTDMVRLNRIRNSVMHPVKKRKWSEDDFGFVRQISEIFRATIADQYENRTNL